MTEDHGAIDELLAGYVLRGLSGEDAAETDRLLSEHVPTCGRCRDTLVAFQGVASDLAFDAAPVDPPETLLPRLRRELEPRSRRWSPAAALGVAAGVLVVVGLAGVTLVQGAQAGDLRDKANNLDAMLAFALEHRANMIDVGPATAVAAPGVQEFYLYGDEVPDPPEGAVYRVWLVAGDGATFVAEFVPTNGYVYLHLAFDPSAYDLLITTEPADSAPDAPGEEAWRSVG